MENHEIDLLKELAHERAIEKETSEIFSPTYFPEPTRNQLLDAEKLQLQKRLVEISREQGEDLWREHARQKEIEKRRSTFMRKQHEKKLSENQLQNSFIDTLRDLRPGAV